MSPRPAGSLPDGAPLHFSELDLLRAVAATLMVINHVAVDDAGRVSGTTGSIGVAAFVGSFAPVIFFFLTGLGYGVQSVGRPAARGHGYLVKVLILLAADAMFWVKPGTHLGLNFLGFIGLSMLLLEWVRRAPWSGTVAAALATLVVALRFLLGPALKDWVHVHHAEVLKFILGNSTVPDFPYPLGPWMAYPLLGYSVGRFAAWRRDPRLFRQSAIPPLLAVLAALAGWKAWRMAAGGDTLVRYGIMTSAYFMASLSAIGWSLFLVVSLCRLPALALPIKRVALSGVRSLAVVPLHYALLMLWDRFVGPFDGPATFALTTLIVLALSFSGSALVPNIAALLNSPGRRTLAWVVVPAAFALGFLFLAEREPGQLTAQMVRAVVQLALCMLLVTSRPSVAKAPPDLPKAVSPVG